MKNTWSIKAKILDEGWKFKLISKLDFFDETMK